MIKLTVYRELLLELMARINALPDAPARIEAVRLGVSEPHLIKLLKGTPGGLVLCGGYPEADLSVSPDGNYTQEENLLLLFLLEKIPAGALTHEEELLRYERAAAVMDALKRMLLEELPGCGVYARPDRMHTEWEYDILGGYSGLSLSLTLTDYD